MSYEFGIKYFFRKYRHRWIWTYFFQTCNCSYLFIWYVSTVCFLLPSIMYPFQWFYTLDSGIPRKAQGLKIPVQDPNLHTFLANPMSRQASATLLYSPRKNFKPGLVETLSDNIPGNTMDNANNTRNIVLFFFGSL